MHNVAAFQNQEARIWPAQRHLFDMLPRCNPTILSSNQKRGTRTRQPVLPMITVQETLRGHGISRIKGETSALLSLAKRILEVRYEASSDTLIEIPASLENACPRERETCVVGDLDADVLDDHRAN
jgi:hypothetical protein